MTDGGFSDVLQTNVATLTEDTVSLQSVQAILSTKAPTSQPSPKPSPNPSRHPTPHPSHSPSEKPAAIAAFNSPTSPMILAEPTSVTDQKLIPSESTTFSYQKPTQKPQKVKTPRPTPRPTRKPQKIKTPRPTPRPTQLKQNISGEMPIAASFLGRPTNSFTILSASEPALVEHTSKGQDTVGNSISEQIQQQMSKQNMKRQDNGKKKGKKKKKKKQKPRKSSKSKKQSSKSKKKQQQSSSKSKKKMKKDNKNKRKKKTELIDVDLHDRT